MKHVACAVKCGQSMTSEELADQVTRCVESLRSRIMGTGDEQYSRGTEQSIETKSGEQIVLETLEELDDAIVYLAHLRARLGKLAQLQAIPRPQMPPAYALSGGIYFAQNPIDMRYLHRITKNGILIM